MKGNICSNEEKKASDSQIVEIVQIVETVEIVEIVEVVYHRSRKSEIRDQLYPDL